MIKIPVGPSTAFSKNVATLFAGNAVAFVLPMVVYPVLSRIFTVEDYALFGVYVGIFSFLEISSAGRYDFGIVLPDNDEEAMNLVWGGLLIAVAYACFILALVIIFRDIVSAKLGTPALADWLLLLPFGLLLISVSKLCNGWLLRAKNFKASSINKASQKGAEVAAQLTFGFLQTGNGLILGDFAGRLFNALFSFYQSLKSGLVIGKSNLKSVGNHLRKHQELPKYGILPAMLNNLGGLLPVLIISSFFSAEISGSFNFSRIVLAVPFALIVTGISQVVMQQVSEQKNRKESIYKELVSVAVPLVVLSIIGSGICFFFGPDLFELIFGAKWREAGVFTSILIFSTAVSFVVSPFSVILIVLGRIRLLSYWQLFYFLAISSLWLVKEESIRVFLLALVAIDFVSYLIYGLLIYRAIKKYEFNLAR